MQLINKHIKIHFKNGIIAEGIVVEWTDNKSILKSLENDDLLIIHQTLENVMMFKVYVKEKIKVAIPPRQVVDDLPEEQFKPDPHLRLMRLVELRELQLKEEKKAIGNNLRRDFIPTGAVKEHYEYPNFAKLKSTNSAPPQSSRSNDRNDQKLSRMRSKTGQSK